MRSFILLCLISCLFLFHSSAQVELMERKKLYELLEQRKHKFDDYSASLAKKTGLFGNKTKKDMQLSNDVLKDIVKTDNNIISVLNRAIDFKTYEKVSMNYNIKDNSDQLENLLHATDTLSKQLTLLSDSNKKSESELQWLRIVNRALVLALIIMLGFLLRKRKKG